MEANLVGKTYVVTGATSGIGLAVAEELTAQGAAVIGIGRSSQRCREAERRLRSVKSAADCAYLTADLALQSQVRLLAASIRETLAGWGKQHLDGLVNNAGTFAYWMTLTAEGFETQWAVNYLASFLLTNALLPLLRAAPAAEVITISSDSHYGIQLNWQDIQLRRHYNGLRAYGQTKLANVLFTVELNRRMGMDSTVRACAADPGLVKTDIGLKGTPALVRWIWQRRRAGGVSAQQSAQGIVRLLSDRRIRETDAAYWKDGQPKRPDRRAVDAVSAQRLWALSERMCGMDSVNGQEENR